MLKNVIKGALRNLRHNWLTTTINVLGLTMGLTVSGFVLLWVQAEESFDSNYPNASRIFRVRVLLIESSFHGGCI